MIRWIIAWWRLLCLSILHGDTNILNSWPLPGIMMMPGSGRGNWVARGSQLRVPGVRVAKVETRYSLAPAPTGMAAPAPTLSLTRLRQHRTHSPATSGSGSASSGPPPHRSGSGDVSLWPRWLWCNTAGATTVSTLALLWAQSQLLSTLDSVGSRDLARESVFPQYW